MSPLAVLSGRGPLGQSGTGAHPLAVRVVNQGTHACAVRGYPRLVLQDRVGAIPFAVTHHGDQVVTAKPPATVVSHPGRAMFVLLNHYRCDLGARRAAYIVRLGFPRARRAQTIATRITDPDRMPNWCGRGDPGSILAVSPFEPTLRDTLAHG